MTPVAGNSDKHREHFLVHDVSHFPSWHRIYNQPVGKHLEKCAEEQTKG